MTGRMKHKLTLEEKKSLAVQGFLKIKKGTKIIKEDEFRGCQEVIKLVIPASVKMIGNSAFKNCINLRKIVFEGEIPTYKSEAFVGCDKIWDVECQYPKGLKEEDLSDFSKIVRTIFDVKGSVKINFSQAEEKELN